MVNKQYISIIRLFYHCSIDVDQEIVLSRVKKQLSAEFDFSATGLIEIDGFSYSKHDVFEELDQPDFNRRIIFHKRIWEHKQLLAVLEKNTVDLTKFEPEIEKFIGNIIFDEFISPYFATSFGPISRNFIQENNFTALCKWLGYNEFIVGENREEAFKPIRIFIDEHIRIINNTNKELYIQNRMKLLFWILPGSSVFLNQLPEEFYFIKNDLIGKLINLTVEVENSYRDDSKNITKNLKDLKDIDPKLEEIIKNNYKIYTTPPRSTYTESSNSGFNLNWLWAIIVIIKILLSVSQCH